MNYDILWITEPPTKAIKAKVKKELDDLLADGLEAPEDLFTHFVQLSSDKDGPSVSVWGREDSPGVFFCRYQQNTRWVTRVTVDGMKVKVAEADG